MYGKIYLERVDYHDILNSNQLQIWWWVLGHVVNVGEHFCNPMRTDTHPGCWLQWKGNYLRLQDYADEEYHNLSVFDAVMKIYGIGFQEAIHKILNESNVNVTVKQQYVGKKRKDKSTTISVVKRPWREEDRRFWQPLGISTSQLEEDKVIPISAFIVNGSYCKASTPAYAIWFPSGRCKIYQPVGKPKWITNCKVDDMILPIIEEEKFSELIISKSYKDNRILQNLGYYSTWVQAEAMSVNSFLLKMLHKHDMAEDTFIFFDNDTAGDKASEKLSNMYDFRVMKMPLELRKEPFKFYYNDEPKVGITDLAEYYSIYGKDKTKELIEKCLQEARDTPFMGLPF